MNIKTLKIAKVEKLADNYKGCYGIEFTNGEGCIVHFAESSVWDCSIGLYDAGLCDSEELAAIVVKMLNDYLASTVNNEVKEDTKQATVSYDDLLKVCNKTRLSLTKRVHPISFLNIVKSELYQNRLSVENEKSKEGYILEYFKIFQSDNGL